MSTHTEVSALETHGLPQTLRTLIVSPERELEPGMRVKARFTVGGGPPGIATVTVRVGFESDKTKGIGSTIARWAVRPDEEIELIVELPSKDRAAPSEGWRDEPAMPLSQQALPLAQQVSPSALRLLEQTRFPGFVRHLFAMRALLPDDALSEKLRGQLDRLYIKLRLPNYVVSDRDIDAVPQLWIDAAQHLRADGIAAYRVSLIKTLEQFHDSESFLDALQKAEFPELDALLDRMRACS